MSSAAPMGRDEVVELLTELGSRLHERGERGDILKVQSARVETDTEDLLHLADLVGAKNADDVLDIAEGIIGADRLTPKAQFFVQEVFLARHRAPMRERIARWLQDASRAVRGRSNGGR